MYSTKICRFDGDSWEAFCQICLKTKFLEEGYQEIVASPGDYGIEGFTRTGKAFQCYCPDFNYSADELYNNQRDKITTDLRKLVTYRKQLKKTLGGVKIKTWYFVTPDSRKKDLIQHCSTKAKFYRQKKLDHLDSNFDVLLLDLDSFAAETPIALNQVTLKLELSCKKEVENSDVELWKSSESTLVSNAKRKHRARFKTVPNDIEKEVDKLTTRTVKEYLEGNEKLRSWEEIQQGRYERYQKLIDKATKRVEDKCLFSNSDNNQLIEEIRNDIKARLDKEFPELDSLSIDGLADYAISKWILDCTIDIK